MKVTVFGATGFLGSHAAEQALLAGHEVTCVLRQGSDASFLRTLEVTIQFVDFNNHAQLLETIEPESIVINCIADTRPHVSYAEREKIEIDLTSKLFMLAQQAGVRRFIQLSTIMLYGFDRPATPIDETWPPKPEYTYSRVAYAREQALLEQHKEEGTELLILRPSNAIGKRDISFLPNFVKSNRRGLFPVVGGGQWSFSCMDARDVGRALVHLMSVGVSKPEVYLTKGYDTDWPAFKAALDAFMGNETKIMNLPKTAVMLTGRFLEMIFPYGSEPPMTRFQMEVLSYNGLFDDSKIRQTGFKPRYTLVDSFEDAQIISNRSQ